MPSGRWNPTGRLLVTLPVDVRQIQVFYAQRPTGRRFGPASHDTGRYVDHAVEAMLPFGHGVFDTRFALRHLRVRPGRLSSGDQLTVEANVANEEQMAGEETIFLFVHDRVASTVRPVLEPKGMAKIALARGQGLRAI